MIAKSGTFTHSKIVDVTNYLMYLTGQPLHAFDYDKFASVSGRENPEIVVRLAREGEKLTLLDDTEVTLNASDIVIASGDTPVALAGAMGGKSTMIDENTKNVLLESATFSLYNLRKTQWPTAFSQKQLLDLQKVYLPAAPLMCLLKPLKKLAASH